MGKRAEILLSKIDEEVVGIEIEDTLTYIKYVESVLEENGIPCSRSKENEKIHEIKFHVEFRKMVLLIPELAKKFKKDHPSGASDAKAGSMHVHFTSGTLFIPERKELRETRDLDWFGRMSSVLKQLYGFMKRNEGFRDAFRQGRRASSSRSKDSIISSIRDKSYDAVISSKGQAVTYNLSEATKNETLEVRINEMFPLWTPLFFLMLNGYSYDDSVDIMKRYRPTCLCTRYISKVYEVAGFANNAEILSSLI